MIICKKRDPCRRNAYRSTNHSSTIPGFPRDELKWKKKTKTLGLARAIFVLRLNNILFVIRHVYYGTQDLTVSKRFYTTFTNFSTKYLVMCKVYTDVGGIK